MDKKLGLYICSGCSIGDSVDVDKLAIMAQKEYKPAVCQTHAFLCGDEGVAIIRRDIERGKVDAVSDRRLLATGKSRELFIRSPDGARAGQFARTGCLVSRSEARGHTGDWPKTTSGWVW